jgi:large subunit ribosomal protein L24
MSVDWKKERVLIEGVNMVTKHVKHNPPAQEGGLIQIEAPIHYSNIQLYNASLGRGVRFRTVRNESGEKQRLCVKTSEVLD